MITVFYDGKCGLCRREIAHYRAIAPINRFEWIDITTVPEPFTARGFTIEQGLMALHVEDDAGNIHQGVAAFIVIWRQLPRLWPVLAAIVHMPFILPLAERCYTAFAAWRFNKLGYAHCKF